MGKKRGGARPGKGGKMLFSVHVHNNKQIHKNIAKGGHVKLDASALDKKTKQSARHIVDEKSIRTMHMMKKRSEFQISESVIRNHRTSNTVTPSNFGGRTISFNGARTLDMQGRFNPRGKRAVHVYTPAEIDKKASKVFDRVYRRTGSMDKAGQAMIRASEALYRIRERRQDQNRDVQRTKTGRNRIRGKMLSRMPSGKFGISTADFIKNYNYTHGHVKGKDATLESIIDRRFMATYKPSEKEIHSYQIRTLAKFMREKRFREDFTGTYAASQRLEKNDKTFKIPLVRVGENAALSKAFIKRYGKRNLVDSSGGLFRDKNGVIDYKYYSDLVRWKNAMHALSQREYRRNHKKGYADNVSKLSSKFTPSFLKHHRPEGWASNRAGDANRMAIAFGRTTQYSAFRSIQLPKGVEYKLRKIRASVIRSLEIATVEAQSQLMRELEYIKEWHNVTGNAYTGIVSAAYVTTDRVTVRKIYEQMPGVKGRRATRGKLSAGVYRQYMQRVKGKKYSIQHKATGAHVYVGRKFDDPSSYFYISDKGQFSHTTGGYAYKEALSMLNQFNPRLTEGLIGGDTKLKGTVAMLKVVSGSPEYIDNLKTSAGGSIMSFAYQRAVEILREKTKHIQ